MRRVAPAAVAFLLAACAAETTEPLVPDDGSDYVPGALWRVATPAALGLDTGLMDRLRSDVAAGRYGVIDGVIVVRYGYVGFEQYTGWSPTQPHTMQSVTKSVTALLFGILAARESSNAARLDRPLLDVFSRYSGLQNVDARKSALTLGHMLEMRTAMDFWEQPYAGLRSSSSTAPQATGSGSCWTDR
jgi:CubicO group peptidase (beta-lactamase class C family)